MKLSTNSKGSGALSPDGIVISPATIARIEDISGDQLSFMSEPCELGIKAVLEVGQSFQPELTIFGQFKRDGEGKVIGWGSAFKVGNFFKALGINGDLDPEDNPIIPAAWLEEALGKTFLRLSYTAGKRDDGRFKYYDWNEIGSISDGEEKLMASFRKSLAKGYPKNYVAPVFDAATTLNPLGV
jgi:hypothetical protein